MKKTTFALLMACCFLLSCSVLKKSDSPKSGIDKLNGTWELNYISGPKIAFEGLYPEKKPVITFDLDAKRLNGNTSCNSFSGPLEANEKNISFNGPMMMTKMFCPGAGENTFLEMLKKVNTYSVKDSTLTLIMEDIAVMRFSKKD